MYVPFPLVYPGEYKLLLFHDRLESNAEVEKQHIQGNPCKLFSTLTSN